MRRASLLHFLDEALIEVRGGRGGNGCVAFRREKFVPRGGPSGGDGGHGGSVVLVGDSRLNTLYHLQFDKLYVAERGRHGEGGGRTGRSGADLEVRVPLGTVVCDADRQTCLGEILLEGEQLVVARGGRGGWGNQHFASPTNRAPRQAIPGEPGEERRLKLELKLLADVGLVGLPNAGKSTFVAAVSRARPKIADYPFTTVVPHLGVVAGAAVQRPFVIADLPGLLEGAARGAGLGHRFLRHVERCRILLHLVDLAAFESSAADRDLDVVERELAAYDPTLVERMRWVVGTKLDAARPERREALGRAAAERQLPYYEVSAATGQGLAPLLEAVSRALMASV